jgi:glucose/arabinose dehydrogenase
MAAYAGLAGSAAFAQSVERLWATTCMKCHGAEGQEGGAGTKTLLTDELMAAKHDRLFFDVIKQGKADAGMEAFGETLEDKQIWGLVNYIRELQAAAHRDRVGSISKKLGPGGICTTQHEAFTIERIITDGLDTPWAMDWLPSAPGEPQHMLVTNRSGEVKVWTVADARNPKDGELSGAIKGIPASVEAGQGGMMEVTVHPDYADPQKPGHGWVYLGYTKSLDGAKTMTTIVRGKLEREGEDWTWNDQQTIFEAKPEHAIASGLHFGVRIVFSEALDGENKGKRYLFFAIGERGRADHAQDLSRPNGKVHRVFDDGEIPSDNPFLEVKDAYPSIYSYGHRNPQGLVIDLAGNLWDTEHGPRGGDEFNLVLKGRNYGWPVVSFGINYNGAVFKTPWPDVEGAEAVRLNVMMPTDRWLPSIGACGMDVVRPGPLGESFPKWRGDILAGGLSGQNVDRIRVVPASDEPSGFRVVEREEIVHGIGRVRDVAVAPDGSVYVALNDPDHIIRLTPVGGR